MFYVISYICDSMYTRVNASISHTYGSVCIRVYIMCSDSVSRCHTPVVVPANKDSQSANAIDSLVLAFTTCRSTFVSLVESALKTETIVL